MTSVLALRLDSRVYAEPFLSYSLGVFELDVWISLLRRRLRLAIGNLRLSKRCLSSGSLPFPPTSLSGSFYCVTSIRRLS